MANPFFCARPMPAQHNQPASPRPYAFQPDARILVRHASPALLPLTVGPVRPAMTASEKINHVLIWF